MHQVGQPFQCGTGCRARRRHSYPEETPSSRCVRNSTSITVGSVGRRWGICREGQSMNETGMTIAKKAALGAAITVALLLATGWVSLQISARLVESGRWVSHTHHVIAKLEDFVANVRDVETASRRYVITGDAKYLDRLNRARSAIPTAFVELERLTADDPNQVRRIADLRPVVERKMAREGEVMQGRAAKGLETLRTPVFEDAIAAMDEVRGGVSRIQEVEQSHLLEREKADIDAVSSGKTTTLLVTLLAALSAGGIS